MYLVSPSRTRFAFGPGKAVLIFGAVIVVAGMASSRRLSLVVRRWPAKLPKMHGSIRVRKLAIQEDRGLVATEKTGTEAGRQHGTIAARTHQRLQPARRQMRIGELMTHRCTF